MIEIENFAMSLNYDFEYFDVYLPHRFKDDEKQILSVNLFKNGKLLNHVIYQTHPDFPEIGVMWTFQGKVVFRNKKSVESFFKEHNVSLEGEVDEFKYEKDLPDVVKGLSLTAFKFALIKRLRISRRWFLRSASSRRSGSCSGSKRRISDRFPRLRSCF